MQNAMTSPFRALPSPATNRVRFSQFRGRVDRLGVCIPAVAPKASMIEPAAVSSVAPVPGSGARGSAGMSG